MQFPNDKAVTIKWRNQILDDFPDSGDSAIRDIGNYYLICCDSGRKILQSQKLLRPAVPPVPGRHFLQVCIKVDYKFLFYCKGK